MNCNTSCDTMVTVDEGAIRCPKCKQKIRGIRVYPDSVAERIQLHCHRCKYDFEISITGQRSCSPRH